MTTALDTIRYNSGMAGEEVANMVDTLEDEIESLRQQLAESQERVKELEDVRQNDVDEYNILNAQLAASEDSRKTAQEQLEQYKADLTRVTHERDRLLKGEYICQRCGIRKNSDYPPADF